MRVAAAQIECRPGDIRANLDTHLKALRHAQESGAELVVFPELSLTDYLSEPDVEMLARSNDSDELREIAAAAGTTAVSVGFIERSQSGCFYNSQALLHSGTCLHVHRKANLPTYGKLTEGKFYKAGQAVESARLNGSWRAATLICADTWNPALPWLAAIQHPEILIVPVASSTDAVGVDFDNPDGWDVNLRHTALTYGIPIVMVNHCGQRNGLNFWGGSRILDPFGQELVRAGTQPELLFADVELSDVVAARQMLPTIRDADPRLVHDILSRLLGAATL